MAILHQATLSPSKLELVTDHLRSIPQYADLRDAEVSLIGAYRFDDPAGQVGIETHIVSAGSYGTVQVPLTYRETRLNNAEHWLIGTMEHSVLGHRWIYNACGDPVYAAELVRTILAGDTQVEQFIGTDEGPVMRAPSATVTGSGTGGTKVPDIDTVDCSSGVSSSVIRTDGLELVVRHRLDEDTPDLTRFLSGEWQGVTEPIILAFLR